MLAVRKPSKPRFSAKPPKTSTQSHGASYFFFSSPSTKKKALPAGEVNHHPFVFWKVALSAAHHLMRIVLSQFRGLQSAKYNATYKCSLFTHTFCI